MKKLILVALTLLTLFVPCFGLTVKGLILDSQTNKPLENVALFLDGTTIGTYSLTDGSFTLQCPDQGNMRMVVTLLGYETASYSKDELIQNQNLKISLKVKAYQLAGVNVQAKEPNRKENMQIFIENCLGISPISNKCKIQNPEVIRFKKEYYKTGGYSIIASANEPILISNSALGYQIRYTLVDFKYSPSFISFSGYPFYVDLYDNGNVPDRIQKNRHKAYRGSTMHFFRSLYSKALEEEGFKVYKVLIRPTENGYTNVNNILCTLSFTRLEAHELKQTKKRLNLYDSVDIINTEATLKLNEPVEIRYTGASEDLNYYSNSRFYGAMLRHSNQQTTIIRLLNDSLSFSSDGFVGNPSDMITMGYWSYRKLGEFLPFDYKPN